MISYRAANAADVPILRAMLQALADHDGGNYTVGPEAGLLQHGFGPRPLFWAIIAETEAPLGMVIYYPDYSTHRGEAGVYVQDIYVSDAARGLGVGRGLMAEMMRQQDWGACFITLAVSSENAVANGFYARLGFRKRGYEMMILEGKAMETL
ncbi:MAG: Acetyltransferase, GNAT family protein [uncultured bacterium]|nr:MAG: Acetyltransferase, GNAT family protein [uncultured bacterium]